MFSKRRVDYKNKINSMRDESIALEEAQKNHHITRQISSNQVINFVYKENCVEILLERFIFDKYLIEEWSKTVTINEIKEIYIIYGSLLSFFFNCLSHEKNYRIKDNAIHIICPVFISNKYVQKNYKIVLGKVTPEYPEEEKKRIIDFLLLNKNKFEEEGNEMNIKTRSQILSWFLRIFIVHTIFFVLLELSQEKPNPNPLFILAISLSCILVKFSPVLQVQILFFGTSFFGIAFGASSDFRQIWNQIGPLGVNYFAGLLLITLIMPNLLSWMVSFIINRMSKMYSNLRIRFYAATLPIKKLKELTD